MKKLLLIFISFLVFTTAMARSASSQKKACKELIERMIPGSSKHFVIELLPQQQGGKDRFEIDQQEKKIILRGTNGVSVASAFYYYLKKYANGIFTWNGSNLSLPNPLVMPRQKINKETQFDYRYYLNYCTFNYSMSWWTWERWAREIDWMAMHGINFPLALLGQNETLYNVFRKLGMSADDLKSYFTGPAFNAWFWMNNIDGWGGPLSMSAMKAQTELQLKILQRERELGMKPILPSFTGHVPPMFKKYFPKVKLNTVRWTGKTFAPLYIIDPEDPMFQTIGRLFLQEQTKTMGTDHFCSADLFNEVEPPTHDSLFLDRMSKRVYNIMRDVDSSAVWVMQGWLFYDSKLWGNNEIKALLNGVPDDKMVILDLYTENTPVWNRTEAYFNKAWIWNLLHCFGGTNGLYGSLDTVAVNPIRDLNNPLSGRMRGIGLSMEAIDQNPVIYELMLDNVWSNDPINVRSWLKQYCTNRYGQFNATLYSAWLNLYRTVYSDNGDRRIKPALQLRPAMSKRCLENELWYSYEDLEEIWSSFIHEFPKFSSVDGFQYDLVDITRQVLINRSQKCYEQMDDAYNRRDAKQFLAEGRKFIDIAKDLDLTMSSRREFMLGKWISEARAMGDSPTEKDLFELNARDLITLWGGKNSVLSGYASKQWSGLISDYYIPRWEMFIRMVSDDLQHKREPSLKKINEEIAEWEWSWVKSVKKYPALPTNDPMKVCMKMYNKYVGGNRTHRH